MKHFQEVAKIQEETVFQVFWEGGGIKIIFGESIG